MPNMKPRDPRPMKDENDSYLKSGQKDENDSYVGKKPTGTDKLTITPEMRARAVNIRKKALRDRISPDRATGTASSMAQSTARKLNRNDMKARPRKIVNLDTMYANSQKGKLAGDKYLKSLKNK